MTFHSADLLSPNLGGSSDEITEMAGVTRMTRAMR